MENYFDKKQRSSEREEKPSWRERDAKKDRKDYGQQDKSSHPSKFKKRNDNLAKKALEDFFKPKLSKEDEKLFKELKASKANEFQNKAKLWIETKGFPKKLDDLLVFLNVKDPNILNQTLDNIVLKHLDAPKATLEVCIGQLNILKLSLMDDDIIEKVDQVIEQIKQKL